MNRRSSIVMLNRSLHEIWYCEDKALIMAFIFGLMEAIIPFGAPALSAWLIDGLETGIPLKILIFVAFAGVIVLFLLNAIQGKMNRCGLPHTEFCNDLVEWEFNEKNMHMDYVQADSQETAQLRARINNDYDWGCGAYFMIPQFQRCCSGIIGAICSILLVIPILLQNGIWKHWTTLVFGAGLIIIISISIVSEKLVYAKEEKLKDIFDEKSSRSNYLMRGGITYREGKDIRLYRAQALIKSALREKERDQMVDGESKLEQYAGLLDGSLSGLLMGSAYLFIVLRAIDGSASVGGIMLFSTCIYRLAENLKISSKSINEILMNARRMGSSFEYLDLPDKMQNGQILLKNEEENLIEFENVSFKYPGAEHPALSDVSFKIEPRKKIAIVGKNGSGKTTMIKLLCHLYEPDDGKICLNSIIINSYDYERYMQHFSVVFQDFHLLALPLGENVAGTKEYDRERVIECLEKAGFGERLKKMKKGIDTYLYRNMDEDGVEISGGEAQKIALARALYKDAPIVILDEPTAALDPISESEIYSGFRNLVKDKTAIFISHRLSSCIFCDEILVFDQGKLVQRGSHDELLRDRNGLYYTMWQAQAQYYSQEAI